MAYHYLSALFLGLVVGVLFRGIASKRTEKEYYRRFETFAVSVLLPIHVLLSINTTGALSSEKNFLLILVLGMVFCVMILTFAHFVLDVLIQNKRYYPHLKYISGTFGGGGRAVVLLAALSPILIASNHGDLAEGGSHFDILAVFDLGYWMFFVGIVHKWWMPLSFSGNKHQPQKRGDGIFELLSEKKSWILFVLAAIGFAYKWGISKFFVVDVEHLKAARMAVTFLIVFTATIAVYLNFSFAKFGEGFLDTLVVFAVRFPPIVCLVGALYFMNEQYGKLAIIPAALMLVVPPSSYAPALLSSAGASQSNTQQAMQINGTWNILFYGAVGIVFLVSIVLFAGEG